MPGDAGLRTLLARVEAANGPDRGLDSALWAVTLPRDGIGLDGYGLPDGAHYEYEARDDRVEMHVVRYGKRLSWKHGRASREAPPLTASLDAAVTLVERALPGWRWVIHNPRSGLSYGASVSDPGRGGIVAVAEKGVGSAPLALCAALLRALVARGDRDGAAGGEGTGDG